MSDIEGEYAPKLRPRYEGEDIHKLEGVLKRRNVNIAKAAEKVQKAKIAKKKAKKEKKNIVVPHVLVRSWKRKYVDKKRLNHMHTQTLPKALLEARVLLAVRNLRVDASPASTKTLKALGLFTFNTAAVLVNSDESRKVLKSVEPYVYYGYPTLETIQKLFSRNSQLINQETKEKITVSDNAIIEEYFGTLGMLCMEDVVDAIWNQTENGVLALQSFAPFNLANLKKAEGMKALDVEQGNIAKRINLKLARILG